MTYSAPALRCLVACAALALGSCDNALTNSGEQSGSAEAVLGSASGETARVELLAQPASPTVADRVALTLRVVAPPAAEVSWPAPAESLGDFTLLDTVDLPPAAEGESLVRARRYTVEPFLPGESAIPELVVTVQEGDHDPVALALPASTLTVRSVLEDAAEEAALAPPRDVVDAPTRQRPWWMSAALVAGALGALAVLFDIARRFFLMRGRAAALAPSDEARAALRAIDIDSLGARRAVAQAADILRRYVERTTRVPLLSRTTDEFLRDPGAHRALPDEAVRTLARFLEAADAVKFAQAERSRGEARAAIDTALAFIDDSERAHAQQPAEAAA